MAENPGTANVPDGVLGQRQGFSKDFETGSPTFWQRIRVPLMPRMGYWGSAPIGEDQEELSEILLFYGVIFVIIWGERYIMIIRLCISASI